MNNLKYLDSDYIPKGEIEGFPLEIIDRMIDEQVKQGNPANVEVLEDLKNAHRRNGGFGWAYSDEGYDFWDNVLSAKKFNLFFEKYLKEVLSPKVQLPLPRVIEVCESNGLWTKRVVFAFKGKKAVCWVDAKTLKAAEDVDNATTWEHWREIAAEEPEPEPEDEDEYQPFDFSNGVRDYSYLMDKIIVNKDIGRMFKVSELFYDDILKTSHINDFECEYLFKHCEFEDGSPVGIKL